MPENTALDQKRSNHEVFRAGVSQVAAQIHRRGGKTTLTKGRSIRLRASDAERKRTVDIRVKTKTRGTWQASIDDGRPREEPQTVDEYWVLVDLRQGEADFYIAPAWWMEDDIYATHQDYLNLHGGHRAENDKSKHHAIRLDRVQQWQDRWDILGIFST